MDKSSRVGGWGLPREQSWAALQERAEVGKYSRSLTKQAPGSEGYLSNDEI